MQLIQRRAAAEVFYLSKSTHGPSLALADLPPVAALYQDNVLVLLIWQNLIVQYLGRQNIFTVHLGHLVSRYISTKSSHKLMLINDLN